jgi:predicted PurR-regulated permease PerM
MNSDVNHDGSAALARRTLVQAATVAAVLLALYILWYAGDLVLLVFAGVLLSILLRRLGRDVCTVTGLSWRWSVTAITVLLVAALAYFAWAVQGSLGAQVRDLAERLPGALANARAHMQNHPWLQQALDSLLKLGELSIERTGVLARITGLASTTLAVVVNTLFVTVIGIYLAYQPALYADGVRRLMPQGWRARAAEVMQAIDDALGRWLAGRFLLMFVNGGLTALALWLLDVPLAFTLGLIAGLLNFIPNFGPVIAWVPAVLVAFAQGPQIAIYTTLVYIAVQNLDGYILTPLVDRRSVELPPVVTLTGQVFLGLSFGMLGLLVGSPLIAAVAILVEMLYMQDVLGEPPRTRAVRTAEEGAR